MSDSNLIKLEWRQFPNNKVVVDGFYAEYQAKDDKDLNKAKLNTTTGIETLPEDLFYEQNTKKIILKPSIMPIDMVGIIDKNGRLVGDWWDVYDSEKDGYLYYSEFANFQLRYVQGTPKRQLIYQSAVQYRPEQNIPYQAVRWMIKAGNGCGYIKNEELRENQGIVFWINSNLLPDNEDNELNIYFYHTNPKNLKQVINGIYITLKSDSNIRIGHFIDIDVPENEKRPSQHNVLTQWEQGTITPEKDIVEWSGNTKVYVMMIIDNKILFGINGLSNPFVFEAQNYDIGTTPEGLTYPILLRENSNLVVHGKGQALFGLKKLHFHTEGTIKTPEFNTGYILSSPQQVVRAKRSETDEIEQEWKKQGNTPETYKVYGEIKLKAQPLSVDTDDTGEVIERLKTYRAKRSETTPIFVKTKIWDDMVSDYNEMELPDNIEGTILSYKETASVNENRCINDFRVDIECVGSFGQMYEDILQKKQLHGETMIKLRGKDEFISTGGFVFTNPTAKLKEYEDISLILRGQETALYSLTKQIGFIISYDDRKITDTQAMQNICNMLNLEFITDVDGIQIPDTIEDREGEWTFQPNITFLEILQKLATIQGYNLFTNEGIVYYTKDKNTSDMIIGRSAEYPCDNINYEHTNLYKSRIYVIGQAGENTTEYRRGEKLVGIWRSKKIENEIGYSIFVKENNWLTNWDMVKKEGDKYWHRFNERPYSLRVDIVDARDCFDKIKIFNTFTWIDEQYDFLNNKLFVILGYTKWVDISGCGATITGGMI